MDWILFFLFSFFWFVLGAISGKKLGELFISWIRDKKTAVDQLRMHADWVLFSTTFAACILFVIVSIGYFIPKAIIDTADVIQSLIFLITFFTLFYTSVIRDDASKKRLEPKINISFHPEEPDCHKTFERLIVSNALGTITGMIDAYYLRFRVLNTGKTTLRNVEVTLEEVKSELINTADFLPLTLTWTLTDTAIQHNTTHIPQGAYRIIDVCKVLKDTDVIRAIVSLKNIQYTEPRLQRIVGNIGVCSAIKPNTYADILPAGSYTFNLSITADNAEPYFVQIAVSFDHIWSDDPSIMFDKHFNATLRKSGTIREEVFA